jgi:uncharacterized protein
MKPDIKNSERFSFRRAWRSILIWEISHPKTVFLMIVIVSLVLGWRLPDLTVKTSIYDMVIEDIDATRQYRSFQETFGSDDIIRVVVKGNAVFESSFFQRVMTLSDALKEIKGIRRVLSLPDIKKDVDPRDRWSLEKFALICKPITMFDNNLLSGDLRTTAITLVLDSAVDIKTVIDAVQAHIDKADNDLKIYQIGIPLVSQAMTQYIQTDLLIILPLSFLAIAAFLFCVYHNIWFLILPLSTVFLSLIWTFGVMSLTHVPFSMLTMIVPVFIMAVGTAYCMHLCDALLEKLTLTESAEDALIQTFMEMFLPTFLAVITTIISLASLMINRITAIQEFSVFASIGLLSFLLIALTLMPTAFAVLLPLPLTDNKIGGHLSILLTRLLDLITHIDLKTQMYTFIITGVVLVVCTGGIFFIKVETNPMEYFRGDTPVSRHFSDIYRDMSGCFPVQVVLESTEEDFFELPDHVAHITRLQAFLESLPKVDKSISFADYLMLVNYATNRYEPEYYNLPNERFEVRMLINNYKMLLGQDMLTTFMSPDFSKANVLLLTHLSSSREFLDIQEKILAHVKTMFPKHLSVKVTGIGMVISESSHHLAKGQINSLWMTMGLVFSIMLILYLSAKVGIVAILVVTIPTITTFGIMGWFGIELNMATGLIASIAIGLAEDNTTHYLIRYNREFKKDMDKDRALRDTIASVGRPIVSMTLVICIGFSFLLFSHFIPTAIFGLLMVATMLVATISNLILLPSLMLHVELVTVWDLLRLMPSLSGLSAGVAHELIQPLNAIKMGSEYLKIILQRGGRTETQDISEVVYEIGTQVDRASEIINRLRVFGEKSAFARESVDINRPIRNTVAILKHQLALDSINIISDLSPGLPPILAHHHRLGQVFYNLIINAGEAIEKRKEIDNSNDHIIHIKSYEDASHVVVTVSDTGIGTSTYLRNRMFEPFFTTKETGKGKGLGMSIVHEIVRDYDGRIEIENKNEIGTTFVLSFPII